MDQHSILQSAGGGTGEREVFEGFRGRAFGPTGLPPVASSLCPRFGAPAPTWNFFLAASMLRSLRTLMISLFSCPAVWTYW